MTESRSEKPMVIVLGTTYSGSGAVYDFLSSREDCYDPLCGSEYLLPQLPYGLMSLRASLGQAFHHGVADHAVREFLSIAKKLGRSSSRIRYGKGYERKLPGFFDEVRRLVRDATAAEFPLQLGWRDAEISSMKRTWKWALQRFANYQSPTKKTWLPVTEREFIVLCHAMHDRLFAPSGDITASFTLLNQAGSGWNPIASTDFFARRKVVLVNRDPRDQFAELKVYKHARDVHEFIKWYKEMQRRISINHAHLFVMRFEEFIINHESAASSLCEFAGIIENAPSGFVANQSALNISKFGKILTSEEVYAIEKNLEEFLWVVSS